MADDGRLREGDLEAINEHISNQQTNERLQNPEHHKGHYPNEGRMVQDAKGRRIIFDNEGGRPRIKWYED
jgi:hypothetical protein